MTYYFQTRSPDSFIQPAGWAAWDMQIPAALAAKVVRPGHSLVLNAETEGLRSG
jgi:hypothetical protein